MSPARVGRRRAPDRPTAAPAPGRVLILSAAVGQGHEGAAHELARRLRQRGIAVEVRDFLDALPGPARRVLRDGYPPIVRYTPWLFDWVFNALERRGAVQHTAQVLCRIAEPAVQRWADGADVVVSTYPLASQALGRMRRRKALGVPAVSVLTDPAAHHLWCHPDIDEHLTVTAVTAADGIRYGVALRPAGALCSPRFARPVPHTARRRVRARLGVPVTAPLVLLSAGSLGMGSVAATVRAVLRHPTTWTVVLCGRNTRLHRRLTGRPRVVALGWRDDVPELMAAADVLVHNAGGLALTEAFVAGLPAVSYRPIPGHGRANARVLEKAMLVPWPRDAAGLVAVIDEVVGRPRHLRTGRATEVVDPASVVATMAARGRVSRRASA